jgi:hypothetical protein
MEGHIVRDGYTEGEVVWLLALSYRDALEEDFPGGSLSQADSGGAGDGGGRVPTLVRWAEVRTAAARIARRKQDVEAAELLARGYTTLEVAVLQRASRQTINRRFRATIAEIVDELGGPPTPAADTTSRIALCLICGARPRARSARVTRRLPGGVVQVLQSERELGVCAECADPGTVRLLTDLAAA